VKRWRAAAWVAAVWAMVAVGMAQTGWTVQTVALRDLRDANAEAARLAALGLAAYTEFTMSEGLQYVRVRVGCYDRREAAEAWATLLRGAVVREATAVPIEAPLPAEIACVAVDVGFLKPASWALVSRADEQPTFEVRIDTHVAYLRHDGHGWRVWQAVAPDPEALPGADAARIARSGRLAGHPVVRTLADGLLCPGQLVAVVGEVAIVDWGDAIVACRVDPDRP